MLEAVSLYVWTAAYAMASILNCFIVYEFKDKKGWKFYVAIATALYFIGTFVVHILRWPIFHVL